MDEMRIDSRFMTGIVSKIVGSIICKKLKCNMNVQINEMRVSVPEDKIRAHLDLDVNLTKEELAKLLKSIGI